MINSGSLEPVTLTDNTNAANSEFAVRIADITIRVRSNDPGLRFHLPPPMPLFAARETSRQNCDLSVSFTELDSPPAGKLLFDSGALWKLYREDRDYVYCFTSSYLGPKPYKIAVFRSDFSSGEVFLHKPYFPSTPIYPLEYPLDELLILNLLAGDKGIEFHACGIRDITGAGYLFAGHSGAGKTTMSGYWASDPGVNILSDDRIIVRDHTGTMTMYGTPWHGESRLSSAASVPLRAIFILKQAKQNEIVPISPIRAAASLFAMSFPLFHSAPSLDFTLQFIGKIVQSVPCFELRFLPESSIIDLVRTTGVSYAAN